MGRIYLEFFLLLNCFPSLNQNRLVNTQLLAYLILVMREASQIILNFVELVFVCKAYNKFNINIHKRISLLYEYLVEISMG